MTVELILSESYGVEAVEEICHGIEQISTIANDIFARISSRLAEFNGNISRVQCDIKRIAEKVNAVQTLKKAIIVHSPARFPPNNFKSSVFLFDDLNKISWKNENEKSSQKIKKKVLYRLTDIKTTAAHKDKFFYIIRKRNLVTKHEKRPPIEKLSSVANLFLFNTSLNFYANDEFTDPLDNSKSLLRQKQKAESSVVKNVNAEHSMFDVSIERVDDPLQYRPELGTLQDFDFPDILPNLSGIVTDLSLIGFNFASIAPSAKNFIKFENEKEANINLEKSEALEISHANTEVEFASVSFVEAIPSSEKTPSRTLSVQNPLISVIQTQSDLTSALLPSASALDPSSPQSPQPPLPPPPPPPPPPPMPVPVLANTKKNSNNIYEANNDDGRASLMEAIRRAGGTKGAKLRSVSQKDDNKENEQLSVLAKPICLSGGDDLMSSLTKALEMRRKVIAGSERSNIGVAALARMSALIPPPPKDDDEGHSDDGSDNNDWN